MTSRGLPCLRATNSEVCQLNEYHRVMDKHTRIYYFNMGASRWLALRLDAICTLFVSVTCIMCVLIGLFSGMPQLLSNLDYFLLSIITHSKTRIDNASSPVSRTFWLWPVRIWSMNYGLFNGHWGVATHPSPCNRLSSLVKDSSVNWSVMNNFPPQCSVPEC